MNLIFIDVFIFFFKQKTAYEMRISDWSSDVCSSDLVPATEPPSRTSVGHSAEEDQPCRPTSTPAPNADTPSSSSRASATTPSPCAPSARAGCARCSTRWVWSSRAPASIAPTRAVRAAAPPCPPRTPAVPRPPSRRAPPTPPVPRAAVPRHPPPAPARPPLARRAPPEHGSRVAAGTMTTVDLKQRWQTFRSWPWGVRWASYVTAALVLTLIATLLTGTVLVRRPFPLVDGEIELAGLKGNVQVIRDDNGIPQIYADTTSDLMLAQGFVHAQDRFFEMDVRRPITAGRLPELFGESPPAHDQTVPTMGLRRAAPA